MVEEEIPSRVEGLPPRKYWQSIADEDGTVPSLSDEEVVAAIRDALEETIVVPVLMLEEVTEITRSISGDVLEGGSDAAIPRVQFDSESEGVAWCSAEAFDRARGLRSLIPQIMEWLAGTPTTDGSP
jgi:hypothetical protein